MVFIGLTVNNNTSKIVSAPSSLTTHYQLRIQTKPKTLNSKEKRKCQAQTFLFLSAVCFCLYSRMCRNMCPESVNKIVLQSVAGYGRKEPSSDPCSTLCNRNGLYAIHSTRYYVSQCLNL